MRQTNKQSENQIMDYLSICMDDPELNVWHLAILSAVLCLGSRQGRGKRIKVSRTRIMKLSHINTLPTYHKYFKQLQDFGYVKYFPSYHPACKSEVELCKRRLSQES